MKVFIVNAFTKMPFGGNPAAVVPLDSWLPDADMQSMAAQHNLSETAFIVPAGEGFEIRWFTPTVEVELCGHATLAAAHICYEHLGYKGRSLCFGSSSGPLPVTQSEDGRICLDFPSDKAVATGDQELVTKGLGVTPLAVFKGTFDYMAVFRHQSEIEGLSPDFPVVALLPARGVIATAKGGEVDFVTRCFYPQSGIDEDPVTGSAYTLAAPYWSSVLGKVALHALQLSKRGGEIHCLCKENRIWISGYARTYLEGTIIY
jgi:PhzF family phenazine biosynthesis protein